MHFNPQWDRKFKKKIDAGSPDRQLKMKRLLEIRWLSWYGQHHLSRACSIKVCCQHHILPIPESMDKGPWLSKHIFVTYGSVPWLLSRTIFCLLYLSQLYIIAWYNCSFFFVILYGILQLMSSLFYYALALWLNIYKWILLVKWRCVLAFYIWCRFLPVLSLFSVCGS